MKKRLNLNLSVGEFKRANIRYILSYFSTGGQAKGEHTGSPLHATNKYLIAACLKELVPPLKVLSLK